MVERLASELGMTAVMVTDEPDNGYSSGADYWLSATDQIIVTRNRAILDSPALKPVAVPLQRNPQFRVWTDDYYNLLGVLKR